MTVIALDGPTNGSTVRLAAAGDRAAFSRIVAAYHGDMVRVAYVVAGGDQGVADDAVQSAWAIAWRKLHSLRDPERLKGWLITIAANEARQIMRRRRAVVVEIRAAEDHPSGPDPAGHIDELDLEIALRRLRPDERELLALRYAAGYDSSDIGALMGTTASSVRGRLARILDHLRRELTDA
jgi:RNA polymerase sigma-70 factor (ECF subfamily)